jgi:hypothetical protein
MLTKLNHPKPAVKKGVLLDSTCSIPEGCPSSHTLIYSSIQHCPVGHTSTHMTHPRQPRGHHSTQAVLAPCAQVLQSLREIDLDAEQLPVDRMAVARYISPDAFDGAIATLDEGGLLCLDPLSIRCAVSLASVHVINYVPIVKGAPSRCRMLACLVLDARD